MFGFDELGDVPFGDADVASSEEGLRVEVGSEVQVIGVEIEFS